MLVDVPEDADAVREETFGPTFTLRKVRDLDEAVALTNASKYALGASVFGRRSGEEIAGKVRSGMVSIISVFDFALQPSGPFGRVGDSGFGRIHGEDGLRDFCYPHSVVRQRLSPPLALMTYDRTERADGLLGRIVGLLHGRK